MLFQMPRFSSFLATSPRFHGRKRNARRFSYDKSPFALASEVLEDRRLLTTLVVNDDGGGDYATIQAAIDAAVAGDIILINGGADRIHTEQGITVNEAVTIQGDAGGTQVIVQAAPTPETATDRVFIVEEGVTAAIDNLMIRHGRGGIRNDGTLTITSSTISQNQGSVIPSASGGIHNRNTLVILNSSITENVGALGAGGILSLGLVPTYLEIRNSEISNNEGAGILAADLVIISNSRIQNNLTGIHLSTAQAEISNSVISGNMSVGFVASGTTFTISNSTISENQDTGVTYRATTPSGEGLITNTTISGNGRGVLISDSFLTLSNSTITANSVGLVEDHFPTSPGKGVTLTSTIIAGNGGSTGPEDIRLQDLSLQATNSLIGDANTSGGIVHGQNGNIVGNNGVGTIDINTVLDPILRDNGGPAPTHALVPGSLAINAGLNPNNLAFDQRGPGFPRTQRGQTDIGAVESPFRSPNSPVLAFGTGGGIPAQVRVFNSALDEVFRLLPYGDFAGGVRVALGDVTGDSVTDVVTAAGAGGGPHVKVFDGVTGQEVAGPVGSFFAYDPGFVGGVYLAVADLNDDGQADIITGAGEGGGPHVRAFSGADGSLLFNFFAYDPRFLGGVRVAAGDITGDNRPDIITGAGPGGGPHVRVFDGTAPQLAAMGVNIAGPMGSFFAYEANDTGGVFVAANNTGSPDAPLIVTGSGPKLGGASVGLFRATEIANYQLPLALGATVATLDFNHDGINDYLTATGPGANGQVQLLSGDDRFTPLPFGSSLLSFFPFGEFYRGGIFVAGSI